MIATQPRRGDSGSFCRRSRRSRVCCRSGMFVHLTTCVASCRQGLPQQIATTGTCLFEGKKRVHREAEGRQREERFRVACFADTQEEHEVLLQPHEPHNSLENAYPDSDGQKKQATGAQRRDDQEPDVSAEVDHMTILCPSRKKEKATPHRGWGCVPMARRASLRA